MSVRAPESVIIVVWTLPGATEQEDIRERMRALQAIGSSHAARGGGS